MAYDVCIESKDGKGRSFKARLLAYAESTYIQDGAADKVSRPVWMMLATSEQEMRPFLANLALGKKALNVTNAGYKEIVAFETLKTSGMVSHIQRTDHGSVATVYLPDLFRLDPGLIDPDRVQFCLLPNEDFLVPNPEGEARIHALLAKSDLAYGAHYHKSARQGEAVADLAHLANMSTAFAAFLDRRTRCPLVPDKRFFAQILFAALHQGLAFLGFSGGGYYSNRESWGRHRNYFFEHGMADVGLRPGVLLSCKHKELEEFLAEQVKLYFQLTTTAE